MTTSKYYQMTSTFNRLGLLTIALASTMMMSCNEPNTVTGPTIPGKVLFEETFEGLDPFSTVYSKEVGDSAYALQYNADTAFRGTHSVRFEVKKGEGTVADGIRSEVVIVNPLQELITKNTWYSFSVYFPSANYLTDHTHDVISQWVILDGSPVRLLTEDDRILLDVGSNKDTKEKIGIDALVKDTWHELVIHIIHSHDSDGKIEVWYDGVKKITYLGGNLYDSNLPKWKIGIYKASYEDSADDKADTNDRVIFFDNIKVGDENSTYEDMKPSKE